jgi:hypothetical protein
VEAVVSKGADHEIAQRSVEYGRPTTRTAYSLSSASIRRILPGNYGLVFAVAGDQESHTESGIVESRNEKMRVRFGANGGKKKGFSPGKSGGKKKGRKGEVGLSRGEREGERERERERGEKKETKGRERKLGSVGFFVTEIVWSFVHLKNSQFLILINFSFSA